MISLAPLTLSPQQSMSNITMLGSYDTLGIRLLTCIYGFIPNAYIIRELYALL
jgi:hypothetical protein